ncbi:hypothetical protein Bca52824_065851 [Brassica carinata]|uniref:Uncharacterized protein n=1 Tax=Brassica carinata TaxID=52824 RepID=A0A8X7UCT4_BRACI|nr:hypothetical protein Bca52824_065851 [Brassica carinata]
MKNLLLHDDDSPRVEKKHFDPTSFGMFSTFSRSLSWMDMDLHLDVSNQTLEQVD